MQVEQQPPQDESNSRRSVTTPTRVPLDYFDPNATQELQRISSRVSEKGAVSANTTAIYEEGFDFEKLLKDTVRRAGEEGIPLRELGVMFKDLRVVGIGASAAVQSNMGSLFSPRSIMRYINAIRHPPVRDILSGFEGVVLAGEMLLVLGSPGSGCSTFLKTIANQRGEYHAVHGDVYYDSFTPEDIEQKYRGDVIYCPEDDVHFPTLTVQQTLEFASTMRTPHRRLGNQTREEHAKFITEILLRIFGLEHVKDSIVGDASIAGISGGQKKRVSIAESLSSLCKLAAWDNSTRGLDSSTALEFARALRLATDLARMTTIVSIYQAGEQLYELFDKLCLIYEGKMVYYGPAKNARQYFIHMGYEPQNRQTTADFLVAVTDPLGRRIRPGFEGLVPRTADEMAAYFKSSAFGELNRSSIDSYRNLYVNKPDLKEAYETSATGDHASHAPKKHAYTLSLPMQVRAVMRRRWQILRGDWNTQAVQLGAQIFQGVIMGTVFLHVPDNTSAYFSRGGVLFFALFFGSLSAMAEIPGLFAQRPIVRRHQKSAMYYPFIEGLAHTIVDIPISFIITVVFAVIFYFLVGLQKSSQQFFIFLLFTFVVTLVMKAFFRGIAAGCKDESSAISIAGLAVMLLVLFTGYAIPRPQIVGGLRWITYLNPLRYAFESLLVNEFHTIDGTCSTLVPQGPGYENATLANQVCTTVGSLPGKSTVNGDTFTYLSYGYLYSNLWKNFGIVCAFGVIFLAVLLLFTQYNTKPALNTAVTLYKDGAAIDPVNPPVDEEKVSPSELNHVSQTSAPIIPNRPTEKQKSEIADAADIFSWKNLQYVVPISGGTRKLLDDVSGYVAPGKLTALMGESGAGKTTLLNVLAQRVSTGVVTGDRLVNGQALPPDFQAQTGYVQQMDTHTPESTVREALLFSAKLRQPASVPMAEKEAYVDKCLKMCGLEAHANAIVGSLSVEHRKRTTIGVELAAKPKLLLFLDEPTSGLDSQSAWAIMTFLRELADSGQAILCTIHQPSGELFQVFDRLLLLRKGGQTVYFGDIGENSVTLTDYFQRNGAPQCAPEANPAEYMLDVIGAGATATSTTDWHKVWKESDEVSRLSIEIENMRAEGRSRPALTSERHSEFATSWMTQVLALTQRGFESYWRNPTYIFSKLAVSIAGGLLIGFTFFKSKDTLQGSQDKLFAIFMATILCVPMSQQLQSKFIENRTVYEVRERPSRIYSWRAFLVSQLLIEIPWNILCSAFFFVCWYWTVGFATSRTGFSFLVYVIVFPLYYTTIGQAVAAMAPSPIIASTLFSTLFSFVIVFSGVLQPFPQLGWWQWMYRVSPFTYLIEALLGQAIGRQQIVCSMTELVTLEPPSGMTCSTYMDPYISHAGGYLTNPNASSECQFCPFRTTDEFLRLSFNIEYSHHWRNIGIVLGVIVFNVFATFVLLYLFRIRSSTGSPFAALKKRLAKVLHS